MNASSSRLLVVDELSIDGKGVVGEGGLLPVHEPATGDVVATLHCASTSQVDDAVRSAAASRSASEWAKKDGTGRGKLLGALADRMEESRNDFAHTVVTELGTPISLALGLQVDSAISHLRNFAHLAALNRVDDLGASGSGRSTSVVDYVPIGVVAALPAYNYPLMISISKLGAALAAGCSVVLVAPTKVPLGVLAIGAAAREVGFPPGALNVIVGDTPEVSKTCATHLLVDAVSFTGSVGVGREVMRQSADGLKRVTLELGGKSPDVVLPDYALTLDSVRAMHYRYLRNAGQGCASPTRILVHRDRMEQFEELSREVFRTTPVGDPWDTSTIVGPVVDAAHRDRVQGFVDRAVAGGGRVVARGSEGPGRGWYVAPHLVGDVDPASEIAQEEIFGPVGVVLGYDDLDEAIGIANGTSYGLASYVHGHDESQIERLVRELRAGSITINDAGEFRHQAPFGGFGNSGMGREWGEYGVREFLEPRHIQRPLGG